MLNVTFSNTLLYQPKTTNATKPDWRPYENSVLLAGSGGFLFALAGFILLTVFTVFEKNNSVLNYAGVGALIAAFISFGFCAHYMDRADDIKRRIKRAAMEQK